MRFEQQPGDFPPAPAQRAGAAGCTLTLAGGTLRRATVARIIVAPADGRPALRLQAGPASAFRANTLTL